MKTLVEKIELLVSALRRLLDASIGVELSHDNEARIEARTALRAVEDRRMGVVVESQVVAAFTEQQARSTIPSILDLLPLTPSPLIGSEGWKKGVLDCIDVLYARQQNVSSTLETNQPSFADAIKLLQTLYARDAK